jgi:hypothetical protein
MCREQNLEQAVAELCANQGSQWRRPNWARRRQSPRSTTFERAGSSSTWTPAPTSAKCGRCCGASWASYRATRKPSATGKGREADRPVAERRARRPRLRFGSDGAPVEQLDLATVIKVLQAASGEIVPEKFMDTLMRTAIEQAGAERGLLVLARGDGLRIAAETATCGDAAAVQLRDQPTTADALPESVLHYIIRARESTILDDAATQPPFNENPYIRHRRSRAIVCLPLINQAELIGVLYLENNLAPQVFAPARIAVLKLLASQAAISLENTRLSGDLQQREAKIRRLVESNIIGVLIWDLEGQILEPMTNFSGSWDTIERILCPVGFPGAL